MSAPTRNAALRGETYKLDTELVKTAKDVSIVATVVVIAIILIVVSSVYLIVRFLRSVVDDAGEPAPTAKRAAWLELRREAKPVASPESASRLLPKGQA